MSSRDAWRANADHFDELYGSDADPWQVRSSWYEQHKLAVVLASLPRVRYGTALEIGCSIGVTTRALVDRCDHVTALDASPRALALAAQELGPLVGDRVTLAEATVPEELPGGAFDLVVLSEVGYFIEPVRVDALAAALAQQLEDGGDLVAVHWRLDPHTLATPGDEVHTRLAVPGLREVVSHTEREFVLQVWRRGLRPSRWSRRPVTRRSCCRVASPPSCARRASARCRSSSRSCWTTAATPHAPSPARR